MHLKIKSKGIMLFISMLLVLLVFTSTDLASDNSDSGISTPENPRASQSVTIIVVTPNPFDRETETHLGVQYSSTGGIFISFYLFKGAVEIAGPYGLEVGTGTYNFYVPSSVVTGSDYRIKAVEYGNEVVNDYSGYFTITNTVSSGGGSDDPPPSFPPLIPGYDLFIMCGVIAITGIILIKRRI